jgi:hypothetical protein
MLRRDPECLTFILVCKPIACIRYHSRNVLQTSLRNRASAKEKGEAQKSSGGTYTIRHHARAKQPSQKSKSNYKTASFTNSLHINMLQLQK